MFCDNVYVKGKGDMVAKVKKLREKIKAIEYVMNYKDFNEKYGDWDTAIWHLFNAKNNWSEVLMLDVLQGCRDENGFYPNFVKLVVTKDGRIDWDAYLKGLGYGFKKSEINLIKVIIEWNEGMDEVIAEFDV